MAAAVLLKQKGTQDQRRHPDKHGQNRPMTRFRRFYTGRSANLQFGTRERHGTNLSLSLYHPTWAITTPSLTHAIVGPFDAAMWPSGRKGGGA